jgi:hypothetical protein
VGWPAPLEYLNEYWGHIGNVAAFPPHPTFEPFFPNKPVTIFPNVGSMTNMRELVQLIP